MNERSLLGRVVLIAALLMTAAGLTCLADGITASVQVAFNDNCERLVLSQIRDARRELLVAAYTITRPEIVSALVHAAKRGVEVRVKYDDKQADYEGMKEALSQMRKRRIKCTGILMSGSFASMHNKFIVVDRKRVLTGSYNFTSPASEGNFENVVLIESAGLADEFAAAFEAIENK